jgi:hypothetical protein
MISRTTQAAAATRLATGRRRESCDELIERDLGARVRRQWLRIDRDTTRRILA